MSEKLPAKTMPSGKSADDFVYRGRPAKDQGDFGADVGLAELEAVDTSGQPEGKYYHGGVVQSGDGTWWVYLEWGTSVSSKSWGADGKCAASFQFVKGSDEADARTFFAKQMHSKNASRLVQKAVGGQTIWVSKKADSSGYATVSPTQVRGLPDAYGAAAPAPAPAPAPKASDPVALVQVVPFAEAWAPLLARVTSGTVQATQKLGSLTISTYADGTVLALPPVPGSVPLTRSQILLTGRALTLPDQQIALLDIQSVDTQGNLTLSLAGGPVTVATDLTAEQGAQIAGLIRLYVARLRAAHALRQQL